MLARVVKAEIGNTDMARDAARVDDRAAAAAQHGGDLVLHRRRNTHSIVLSEASSLIFLSEFFRRIENFRLWDRQSAGLLILKRKFAVPQNSHFQRLSASDG